MKPLLHSDLLVTLAEKQGSPALIKVWDLTRLMNLSDSQIDDPEVTKYKFVTSVVINEGNNAYPISCFAFNEYLTCIAIGYTDGKVVLIRGDMLRDRGYRKKVIYESADSITGIHFNRFEEILYVTTTSKIVTVPTTGRNQGKPLRTLSNSSGVDVNCSDLEHRSSKLIVANTAGLKYFNHVSRANLVNFNVEKKSILRLFKEYLLVVCSIENGTNKAITKVVILDMLNMHVSFSLTIPQLTITHTFSSDNDTFFLSTDGILYRLHEKPVNQQVEIVLQRELYPIASNLATQYNLDESTRLRIYRLHADYLYAKRNYDEAIEKYTACLPLYPKSDPKSRGDEDTLEDFIIGVVTKFKEVLNIKHMATFLATLHELGLADNDHVTLLVSCYCKLGMVEEIDLFIDKLDVNARLSDGSKFDASELRYSLIINLLKECRFYLQATKILFKLEDSHSIVEMQLFDLHNVQKCMSYIRSLPVEDILRILVDFLKEFLDSMPLETTDLLIQVFTGTYEPQPSNSLSEVSEEVEPEEEPEKPEPQSTGLLSYTAFLGYLSRRQNGDAEEGTVVESNTPSGPTYQPPRPNLVFPCFIEHPKEFIVFLEACLDAFDKYQGDISDRKDLLKTLLEEYLAMSEDDPENKEDWLDKARSLMKDNRENLDTMSALLLCKVFNFEEGEMMMRESAQDYEELLFRSAQLKGDVRGAFEVVNNHGPQRPVLYKLMLKFIVSAQKYYETATRRDFIFLLDKIDEHKLATPLELVSMLSKSEVATIGIIKDYLIDYFTRVNKEAFNNEKLLESYNADASKYSRELSELANEPYVLRNKNCANCELKLEIPIVHFRCGHSYHDRCLSENIYIPGQLQDSPQCPLCISELKAAKTLHENEARAKDKYDVFQQDLENATDRFKVMCDYVGKGALEWFEPETHSAQ